MFNLFPEEPVQFRLDLETVKKNAREYYDAGKLTAQHPDENQRLCVNYSLDGKGYRCAVAASFPEDYAQTNWNGMISCMKGIEFNSEEEFEKIAQIQVRHDVWTSAGREGYHGLRYTDMEARFLALIDYPVENNSLD